MNLAGGNSVSSSDAGSSVVMGSASVVAVAMTLPVSVGRSSERVAGSLEIKSSGAEDGVGD